MLKIKQKRKYDLLSVGLMVYDIIISPTDRGIFDADTYKIDDITFSIGGDALNVAVDCSKLGLKTAICGMVGEDAPGEYLKKTASGYGINTDGIITDSYYSTSCSVVLCEEGGQRHFAYYGKSNYAFDGSSISDELLSDSTVLYVGSALGLHNLSYDKLTRLLKRAKEMGCITVMDATSSSDDIWLSKIEGALPYCDVFIPSYDEAYKISGLEDPCDIINFFRNYGVKISGVKCGKDGIYLSEDIHIPAFRCDKVIDTTGAGDAFMAGFLTGIVNNMDIRNCALLGSAASNCVIRETGATVGIKDYSKTLEIIELEKSGLLK